MAAYKTFMYAEINEIDMERRNITSWFMIITFYLSFYTKSSELSGIRLLRKWIQRQKRTSSRKL